MTRAAVMGSGSWGTAFASVLADAGTDVTMWAKDPVLAEQIDSAHENPRYHPGIGLPPSIHATTDPAAAMDAADFVVLAIPSQTLRENLARWLPFVPETAVYVSLMKGIELGTGERMSEVVREVADVPAEQVAVVSGPNLAREIMQRQPAATVVACTSTEHAARLQQACLTDYFRPYTNTDVIGAELGGAVKNVIALANGIAVGMGFGENAQASLITRGLAEMTRLGVAMGAEPLTFAGLAGLGDLIATCSSPLSRNRTVGVALGRGLTLEEATAEARQTCEGVKSARPILEMSRARGVEMPITEQVVRAIHEGCPPGEIVAALMSRGAKSEQAAR